MNLFFRRHGFRSFLLAGLLFSGVAFGAPPATKGNHAATTKAAKAPRKLFMWKAVSDTNVVYFFGSIHLGDASMYPLPKVVTDAFNRSKVLVVEVDITKIDPSQVTQFVSTGQYSGGDDLWKHLSPSTSEKVKKVFAKYDFPEQAAGQFKPWLAGMMMSILPMMKAGMQGDLGIDKHFLDLAEGKKDIEQVETAEFQFKLLASLPDSLGDTYLSYTADGLTHAKDDDLKIAKLWKAGDTTSLEAALDDYPKALRPWERTLLEDRNPHMADYAEKYLKGGGPCFFVVGTAHLLGKEGVISILKQRGYSITQLSAE